MTPKDNFLNAKPSITTNNEAARADDLSTTDHQLEETDGQPIKALAEGDEFVNGVNDAAEPETIDNGMEEEA